MTGSHFGAPGSFTPPPAAAGDAGSKYLSFALDAPLDAEGSKRVSEGGNQLKTLAENGGFAVNEEGMQAYLKACDFFIQGYSRMINDLQFLATRPQMGASDYAHAVAEFNVKVAEGDERSMIPNLIAMRTGIEKAREAMVIARKNYRETEDAHSVTFAKMNKDLENQ